jgi:hypothetical protein
VSEKSRARRRWLVLLVWVLVAFFYFAISWDYVRTNWNHRKFADYMQYVAQVVGDERRSPAEARILLEIRASELGLPVRPEHIVVLGGGTSISISVSYEVDIDVPIFESGIYRKLYQHKVSYRSYR